MFKEKRALQNMPTKAQAPENKYRVIGTDHFPWPPEDYFVGDYDSLQEARDAVEEESGSMTTAAIYDDQGTRLQ